MDELVADIRGILESSGALKYISDRGGFFPLRSMEEFPHQMKTPCVVIVDGGVVNVQHWTAKLVARTHRVEINAVQRLFNKQEIIAGSPYYKGVEQVSRDIIPVLDMQRLNGKYLKADYVGENRPETIEREAIFLQYKALIFEYVRVE